MKTHKSVFNFYTWHRLSPSACAPYRRALTTFVHLFIHLQSYSVLQAAAWIEEFAFCKDIRFEILGYSIEFNQRSIPDHFQNTITGSQDESIRQPKNVFIILSAPASLFRLGMGII